MRDDLATSGPEQVTAALVAPGPGPPCTEAQADGVPCDELKPDCDDCERAPPPKRLDEEVGGA